MKRIGVCAALTLALGAVSGCLGGDDDGGSNAQVDTGLEDTRLLSSVTGTEATQACEAVAEAFTARLDPEDMLGSFCEMFAAALTSTESECQQQKSECVEQAQSGQGMFSSEQFEQDIDCSDASTDNDFENCEATVGQLEQCFNDQLTLFETTFTQYTCADAPNLSFDDLEGLSDLESELPASCEAIVNQCPDFEF